MESGKKGGGVDEGGRAPKLYKFASNAQTSQTLISYGKINGKVKKINKNAVRIYYTLLYLWPERGSACDILSLVYNQKACLAGFSFAEDPKLKTKKAGARRGRSKQQC